MNNPTRRNRNIGTEKQGHGQDNKLIIPQPADTMKSFYERLDKYEKEKRFINGHEFLFVTEQTRKNSKHACTIDDIEKIISHIPKKNYGELKLIVLRQPKRKEEILSPVWGRLIYSYEFEDDYFPAIIIEAFDYSAIFKWSKKLSLDALEELERLKNDGHNIIEGKRHFTAEYKIENVRQTQLYRTLSHEFGHYAHYLTIVKEPLIELKNEVDLLDEQIEREDTEVSNIVFEKCEKLYYELTKKTEELEKLYFAIPSMEKEKFAHKYADNLKKKLLEKGVIPFERIEKK